MEMFVEDIIDMGAELLNPVQIWNDQAALKARFGKQLVFYGGLNNQQITEAPYPQESQIRAGSTALWIRWPMAADLS